MITDYEIVYDSFLLKKKLELSNIAYFEITETGIKLYAKQGKPKHLTISNYLTHYDQALDWAKARFDGDTSEGYEEELIEAANNEVLGDSVVERVEYIEKVRKRLKWLKITTIGIPILHLTAKWATAFTVPVMLSLPLLFVLATIYYKNAVKLYDTKKHLNYFYPNALGGIAISSILAGLFALFQYDIYDMRENWTTIGSLAFFFVFIIWRFAPDSLDTKPWHRLGTLLFLFLFFGFYSIGLVVGINCTYDTSDPYIYKAIAEKKYISKGKTKSHNIKLNGWGPLHKTTTLEHLKAKQYDSINIGDTIELEYHAGLFNIPWYELRE